MSGSWTAVAKLCLARGCCRAEPESGLLVATERKARDSFQAPDLLAEVRQQEREACEAVAAVHLALGLLPPPERRHSTASSATRPVVPLLPYVNASDLAGAVQQLIAAFKVSWMPNWAALLDPGFSASRMS